MKNHSSSKGWKPQRCKQLVTNYDREPPDEFACKCLGLTINNVDIKSCRKGFVHTDRFYSNVKVLQQAICTRQWNGKEVNIVFLDLEKALETAVPYWHKKCPERLWKECTKCMVILSSIHKYSLALLMVIAFFAL